MSIAGRHAVLRGKSISHACKDKTGETADSGRKKNESKIIPSRRQLGAMQIRTSHLAPAEEEKAHCKLEKKKQARGEKKGLISRQSAQGKVHTPRM